MLFLESSPVDGEKLGQEVKLEGRENQRSRHRLTRERVVIIIIHHRWEVSPIIALCFISIALLFYHSSIRHPAIVDDCVETLRR